MDVMSYPADTKTPLRVGSSWEFVTRWNKLTVLAKSQVGPITLGTFLEPSPMCGSLYQLPNCSHGWYIPRLEEMHYRKRHPYKDWPAIMAKFREASMTLVLEHNPWPLGRSAVASLRVVLDWFIGDTTLKWDFLSNVVGLGVSPIIRWPLKGVDDFGNLLEPVIQVQI